MAVPSSTSVKNAAAWVTDKPIRKRRKVTITITVTPAWLSTINSKVPSRRRSQFLALAGFLALADTSELRQHYRSAIDVLLGRVRV